MFKQLGIRIFLLFDKLTQFVYRASDGRIGAVQGGVTMLLLDSIGRKSGKIRTHCLQYQCDGDDYLVVASNFGKSTPANSFKAALLSNCNRKPKSNPLERSALPFS